MQTQLQPYAYHPLAPNSIRLLGLHPNPSSSQYPFTGTLKTVHIDDAPEYYCLSYTWGNQSEDVEIEIDGMGMCVRPSLVDTLGRLRELAEGHGEGKGEELKVQWVWIDRICINQVRSETFTFIGGVAVLILMHRTTSTNVVSKSAAWALFMRKQFAPSYGPVKTSTDAQPHGH